MSEKFEYKYEAVSIEEKQEIESIRKQYLPKQESTSKIERLKYLDRKVNSNPTILALSLGVIGILFFGTGMTFFLQWTSYFYIGIPFVILGSAIMAIVYPLYKKLYNHLKDKYTDEILKLSEEILNNSKND